MVFSSISFLCLFFPLVLLAEYVARNRRVEVRNSILIAFSLLFYVWGEAWGVFLLLASSGVNFWGGRLLAQCENTIKRKRLLMGFVVFNLLILFVFKYAVWLMATSLSVVDVFVMLPEIKLPRLSLPLGLSFFTFHAISYLVDIYRRQISVPATAIEFFTYFTMFPHLVAGPIVRYRVVEKALKERSTHVSTFAFGVRLFLVGLAKKVLIANSLAPFADTVFAMNVGEISCGDAWLGALAYTMQIYFDFSGYSDMAIGLAAMLGFHFETNFLYPYCSKSIREFWRRWHISLSHWLRDYIYIPLGGSRQGVWKTYRNLLIVFVLCGLWHGANSTFVVWGLYHGVFLVLERSRLGAWLERLPALLQHTYAFTVVLFGWILFRSHSLEFALGYMGRMLSLDFGALLTPGVALLPMGIAFVLSLRPWYPQDFLTNPEGKASPQNLLWCGYTGLVFILGIAAMMLLVAGMRSPFIYFNF